MAHRRKTFEIETGYGQKLEIFHLDIASLFLLRATQTKYDDEGEEIVSTVVVESVMEASIAHRLAVALYHATAMLGEVESDE